MNPWRRGTATSNPYHRTAFRIAGVAREVTSRRTLAKQLQQLKYGLQRDPDALTIQGVAVTETDLNLAERILLDPGSRQVEALLYHATENPTHELQTVAREAVRRLSPPPGPYALTDVRWLLGWLAGQPDEPALALGALELTIPPPFGEEQSDGPEA